MENAIAAITTSLTEYYRNGASVPFVNLVALAVQLADKYRLLGAEKLLVVRAAVTATIARLPLSDEQRLQLVQALPILEGTVETVLALLKTLNPKVSCLAACFGQKPTIPKVPFPLVREA